jgi:GntR family transcriptional regulator, transcriptional repressor for pyruvate dehydrogenase complex
MLDPSRIHSSRTSDSAESYLRSLIFTGRLAPGDPLPPERELAAQLGIARITLRVALKALENAGLLKIKVGSKGGPYVNDHAAIAVAWETWMRTHADEIGEILEFRRTVEERIAALAAERRTEDDLAALEGLVAQPADSWHSFVHWHYELESALGRAAHNRYLTDAMLKAEDQLFFPVQRVMEADEVEMVREVHGRIVAAIRDRDPERARTEMGTHLVYSEKLFKV